MARVQSLFIPVAAFLAASVPEPAEAKSKAAGKGMPKLQHLAHVTVAQSAPHIGELWCPRVAA
jgi:hypothetical protein